MYRVQKERLFLILTLMVGIRKVDQSSDPKEWVVKSRKEFKMSFLFQFSKSISCFMQYIYFFRSVYECPMKNRLWHKKYSISISNGVIYIACNISLSRLAKEDTTISYDCFTRSLIYFIRNVFIKIDTNPMFFYSCDSPVVLLHICLANPLSVRHYILYYRNRMRLYSQNRTIYPLHKRRVNLCHIQMLLFLKGIRSCTPLNERQYSLNSSIFIAYS